jgi:hypothetical protein
MQVNTCMSSNSNQARDQVIVTLRIRADDWNWRRVATGYGCGVRAFVSAAATTVIGWLCIRRWDY